jgi:DNA-directed RNA polymerase specialized sigma24 family protein
MRYENAETFGIAVEHWANWMFNHKIAKQRAHSVFLKLPEMKPTGQVNAFIAEGAIRFDAALRKAPVPIIEAFLIYHLLSEPYKAKAARLGVSQSTLHSRLVVAHRLIATELAAIMRDDIASVRRSDSVIQKSGAHA